MTAKDLQFVQQSPKSQDWTIMHGWYLDRIRAHILDINIDSQCDVNATYDRLLLLTNLAIPATCRKMVDNLGVDKILGYLPHRILDAKGDYQLIQLDWVEIKMLKMKNPSTGQWHLEAVHPNFFSVSDALSWRNHGWFIHADKLT